MPIGLPEHSKRIAGYVEITAVVEKFYHCHIIITVVDRNQGSEPTGLGWRGTDHTG